MAERGKMKYFEILYKNCIDKKYVGLSYGKSIEDVKQSFPTFNGCRLIDIKETDYESYRRHKIQYFKQYSFSA